jgi:glycosyltransferase involved in cell wall biosynthesis
MSAFDLFCLSSDHEGLPVALMEAKALGLPVAATSVGGIPAAVADGVDGLVVPPQDKRALVEAILSLRDDDRRRSDLARASLRSAERFDATVAVAQIESSYLPSTGG